MNYLKGSGNVMYPPKCQSPGWFPESSSIVPPTAVTGLLIHRRMSVRFTVNEERSQRKAHLYDSFRSTYEDRNVLTLKTTRLFQTRESVCDPLFSNQITGKINQWKFTCLYQVCHVSPCCREKTTNGSRNGHELNIPVKNTSLCLLCR